MSTELPHKITFGPVDKMTVGLLKLIHRALLPVHYKDGIYEDIKNGEKAHGILAFYNDDTAVGEICYRIEKADGEEPKLYIMTIGVLKPYQRQGIASQLFNKVVEDNKEIKEVYLHVHVENPGAVEFYKKLGFSIIETLPDYYKSLPNQSAIVMSRKINQESQ